MALTKVTYSMITGAPVNVRDFGATGNGTTDDTAAIQRAVDYAKTLVINTVYSGSTTSVNAAPAIVFPSGVYRMASTVSLQGCGYIKMLCDGKALIVGAAATTKTVTAFSATDLRYLYVEALQFQNFNTVFNISTGNLDLSMWSFVDCQIDGLNKFVDSGSYATSRSTFVEFTRLLCQYQVLQIIRSFCDILTFNDCWLGHGNESSLIYANSLVNINGGAFVPAGSTSEGKCYVYLTNDNGAGGTVTDTERGVYIRGARSGNEGGNCPLIVSDFPIPSVYQQNPVISISNCTLTAFHPSQYESGGTETGIVHLKQYPAIVSFASSGLTAIGAATGKLVSAQSTLPADADPSFGIEVDAATMNSAMWAVGESSTYTLAGALRGYINNPDPSIFRSLLEEGFLDTAAATTSGIFKSTFSIKTGYADATYMAPITFLLVLTGQGANVSTDFGYAGSSTYMVTVAGYFSGSLKLRLASTKLHGQPFGNLDGANADIVSLHFGSAETGLATTAMAASATITVTFGAALGFAKARIINYIPRSNRYGTYPS